MKNILAFIILAFAAVIAFGAMGEYEVGGGGVLFDIYDDPIDEPEYRVDTVIDENNGADFGLGTSLREAIALVENGTIESVKFDVTGVIHLSHGPLVISGPNTVNIYGPGSNGIVVDAGGAGRVFEISSNASINNIGIINGASTRSGGGVHVGGFARAVFKRCTIRDNVADDNGGGIYATDSSHLLIDSCSLIGNSARHGGAFYFASVPSAFNDTYLKNSTVSGNSATLSGGGIYTEHGFYIQSSTITDNDGGNTAGGIYVAQDESCTMINTIVAGNSPTVDSGDIDGRCSSWGNNIIGVLGTATFNPISGDTVGTVFHLDPLLDPIGDNGGPTWTHALREGSLAIDPLIGRGGSVDQRGYYRVGTADIGSYEYQGPVTPPDMSVYCENDGVERLIPDGTTSTYRLGDFGALTIGSTLTKPFWIVNSEPALLHLLGTPRVELSGPDADVFMVTEEPHTPVLSTDPARFQITVLPTTTGVVSATVSISSNDPDEDPYDFPIRATVLEYQPDMSVYCETVDGERFIPDGYTYDYLGAFGEVSIDSTLTKPFSIVNSGPADLHLLGTPRVELTGPDADGFVVTEQPHTPVLPGDPAIFQITVLPTKGGVMSATVSISNNDPDEDPYDFAINATVLASEIEVKYGPEGIQDGSDETSPDDGTYYGSVDVVGSVSTRRYTIWNLGLADLYLEGSPLVEISGPHASEFTVSEEPLATVPGGGSTEFEIGFDPGAEGLRQAVVTIQNSDRNEPDYSFAIEGTGVFLPHMVMRSAGVVIEDGDTTPSPDDNTDMGGAVVAEEWIVKEFAVCNMGASVLRLDGQPRVQLGGPSLDAFSVETFPDSVVAPGDSTTFMLRYDPTRLGMVEVLVQLESNDAGHDPYRFTVSAEGVAPSSNIWWVNTLADEDDGIHSGDGMSLREAVAAAGPSHQIGFMVEGEIQLTLGALELDDVDLIGPGADRVAISGGGASRVVTIRDDVTLSGVTVTSGHAARGGGILVEGSGVLIRACMISGNVADDAGGGVFVSYTTGTVIDRCTMSGNEAPLGSAVGVESSFGLQLLNSTISGNGMALEGGAVYSDCMSAMSLENCTVTGNEAYLDAGLRTECAGNIDIRNSIVAGNTSLYGNPDVSNHVSSSGNNVIGNTGTAAYVPGAGDVVGTSAAPVDPMLDALGDYGGSVATHRLQFGSVAIDPAGGNGAALLDQRGHARSGVADVGAYEMNGPATEPEISITGQSVEIVSGGSSPSTGDGTIFGDADVGGDHVERTFIIYNTGDYRLDMTGDPLVDISGPDAGDFYVSLMPLSSAAASGGATVFRVRFEPTGAGQRSALVNVQNSDGDEALYSFAIQGTGVVTTGSDEDLPRATDFERVFPNPFNPVTNISLYVRSEGRVRVDVYDISGRRVDVLMDEVLSSGLHEGTWDGRHQDGRRLPSGPYYLRMLAEGQTRTRKVMLLK